MLGRFSHLRLLVAFTALATLGRLAMLTWPSVNLEFAFADAALYFQRGDASLIAEYFSLQANTVAIPFGVAHVARLFGDASLLGTARALSLCGVPLLAWGLYRLCRQLGRTDADKVSLYVTLNPLVWIYASRATADFLPVALGVLAVSFLSDATLGGRRVAGGALLLGLAAVMKYHAVFLLLFAAALTLGRGRSAITPRVVAVVLTAMSAPLIAYLIAAHEAFGFWVTPPEFQSKHQFSSLGVLSNAICYAGYLTLLAWPTVALLPEWRSFIRRNWRPALAALVILPVAGALLITDNGEMNMGPLDRWVSPEGRTALFTLFAAGMALPLLAGRVDGRPPDSASRALWMAAACFLLILSFTRPAQRYLLFIIPFVVLAIPATFFSNRRLFHATLILFCAANAFADASRWCTGTAAERMVREVQSRGLMERTDPGAVLPHAGSPFFRAQRGQLAFTIVAGTAPDALVTTRAGLSFFEKSYSLVPRPRPTDTSSGI